MAKKMPNAVKIEGRLHRQVVFLVTSLKADGTPHECRRIADDEKITLNGKERFITAYTPTENLVPK